MTKKILISLALTASIFGAVEPVYAKTECSTGQYGQNVVCKEIPDQVLGVHEPVDTGIADNPIVFGLILLSAAGGLTFIAKRAKAASAKI